LLALLDEITLRRANDHFDGEIRRHLLNDFERVHALTLLPT
jgi:hypothetical protein